MANRTYCKNCGHIVSRVAKACPNCGHPTPYGGFSLLGTVLAFVGCMLVIIAIIILFSC
ncbi:MAG TPA: zinc-ribbon domain-containing protein [Dehalococcoidales bacterium]